VLRGSSQYIEVLRFETSIPHDRDLLQNIQQLCSSALLMDSDVYICRWNDASALVLSNRSMLEFPSLLSSPGQQRQSDLLIGDRPQLLLPKCMTAAPDPEALHVLDLKRLWFVMA
jgi:hypothetical protein